MRFADRMTQVRASAIRDFFDRGRRMEGAIDLSIGQGDFDVPEPIKAATIEAIQGECGRYSPTGGYPDVVAATRSWLREHYDLPDSDALMLTSGASGALTLAMLALAGPGDEVLLPDPFFVVYGNLAHIVGAKPTFYNLYPNFRLDPDEVERNITPRTRLLVVNSPSNPTGTAYTPEELAALVEICGRRGVPIVSDELYERFTYDGTHTSIKAFPGCESLLVGGLSKTYGMAGWRLGWAAGPPELIDRMRVLQQFSYTCPPTLVQRGAVAAFHTDMSHQLARYRRKRDLVYNGLVEAGYEVMKPQGSFFIFPKVPDGDDLGFCERAISEKLIVVPGRAFSRRTTHFRLCFAALDETLERGLEVLLRIGP